jgi:radical SAM protein with 4Fe4S-binding SPASM domain
VSPPARDDFFLCYFETTRTCNLHCRYCMARLSGPPAGHELSTEEAKTLVIDEIARVSTNAAVAFSGGEHLLRPDAFDLLAHAAERGLWSFVNTNGKVLVETDSIRKAVKATGGRLVFVLPLNSTDPAINRSTRDDDPSTVMRAAERCRAEGAEYFFILTISRDNLPTLDKTMKFLKMNRVAVLRAPFVPRGAGRDYAEYFCGPGDMRDMVHPALTANPLAYISFTPFFASPEAMDATWKKYGIKISGLGCQAGRAFAAVGAEGGVVPCVQLLDSACTRGNVREKPLSEIIRDDPVFNALRERSTLKGKCGRCRYRDTCGGCRALSFYRNGDILAEDPSCFFEPVDQGTHSELEDLQTAKLGEFLEYLKFNKPWNSLF